MNQEVKMDGGEVKAGLLKMQSLKLYDMINDGRGTGAESGGEGRQLSVLLTLDLASFNTPTSRVRLVVVKGSWDLISGS